MDEIQQFLRRGHVDFRPNLTVDCAIFGYREGELKLLLVKNRIGSKWCLPGGFVKKDENLTEAAARVTANNTGIDHLFLKQFKAFGDPGRNTLRGVFDAEEFFKITGFMLGPNSWLMGETVSIGFYAITDMVKAVPKADLFSSECAWFSMNELPDLANDHSETVREALFAMRIDLYHFPIGKNLLQPKFTLKEIKTLYEVLSRKKLHPTNFPNKLVALGLISKLEEKRHIGAHRAPAFYTFNDEVYAGALLEGVVLV
jgi:8-oxo-dGTP diphosphatase